MTSCPRCGRVADDEIVCANCGMSLALVIRNTPAEPPGLLDEFADDDPGDSATGDVKLWRLGALVCVTCVVAATIAILLLNSRGGSRHTDVGLPFTSGPASPTEEFALTTAASSTTSLATLPRPSITASPTRSRTGSSSPSRSATASVSPSATVIHVPPSTSTQPSPTPTVVRTTPGSPTSSHNSAPSVHLAKGLLDPRCGPHCYPLVVTLTGFVSGPHQVVCSASHSADFAAYTTTATISSNCTYSHPNDTLYVVVDGRYYSNTVAW